LFRWIPFGHSRKPRAEGSTGKKNFKTSRSSIERRRGKRGGEERKIAERKEYGAAADLPESSTTVGQRLKLGVQLWGKGKKRASGRETGRRGTKLKGPKSYYTINAAVSRSGLPVGSRATIQ